MQEVVEQVFSHIRSSWRYRWYAVAVAWAVALAGWVVVYQLPNRYEASARVYVDTQSVLRPLLAGLAVQPNVGQVVNMMSRTLISRPNLEKVIGMADMDIKLKSAADKEQMIDHLTKQLAIKSAGAENLYTISYTDDRPQEAKRIVQSLLTLFVEGNLGNTRKDSDSARRFINEQLSAYNEKLVAAERAVTEFKRKNVGLMGADGQNYYVRYGEAQTVLSQATLALREAETSRDAIKRQIEGEAPPSLINEQPGEIANPELDARIQELQKQLDNLQLRYTETHPDIIAINRSIRQLREQKEKEAKLRKPTPQNQSQQTMAQQLSLALASAEANVASMRARVGEFEKRLNALKAAANSIPQVDAEFTQLTRDYEVNKKNYESLLARRESASITGEMEASSNAVSFRVVDPPQVPTKPSAPNRPALVSLVLLGALAAGIAVAFLMSQFRPTVGDERRLRVVSGLPVFGTVVMAWSTPLMQRRKRGVIALVVSFAGLLSVYAGILGVSCLLPRGPSMSIVERAANMLGKLPDPGRVPADVLPAVESNPLPPDFVERAVAQESAKATFSNDDNLASIAVKAAVPTPAVDVRKSGTTVRIDLDKLREQNMTTPDGERTPVSESFRRIKRHLLANVSSPDASPDANLIMITSSLPAEGKTFCTVNLAISIAMEMDRRVLLVDAGIRPSVAAVLGIKPVAKGLMDILLDGISLADVLCNTNIEKLSLLPAGRKHSHATELLASDAMRAMLKEMAERYHDRIIIFDSPPLLATTESSVLASLMGQVLVVVEAGKTTEQTLKDALSRIASNGNVIGVLLNKGAAPGSAMYGGYGYGYGYGDADGRKE